MNERELDLTSLEPSFGDPAIAKLLEDAHLVNEYLAETSVTDEDASDVVNTLHRNFNESKLKGEQVFLTGEGWIISSGEWDDGGGLVLTDQSHMNFVDQEVHILDIVMQESTDLSSDGVTTRRKLYLHARTPIEISEEGDSAGTISLEECVVSISSDMLVRHEALTAARAEAWLDLYFPDEKDFIFEVCANADNEADALQGLSSYSVDVSGVDSRIVPDLTKNMEVYLQDQLQLAADLPYLVAVSGDINILSSTDYIGQGLTVLAGDRKEFMYFYGLQVVHDADAQVARPWVVGAIVRSGGSGKVSCRLPVDQFDSITSIRTALDL